MTAGLPQLQEGQQEGAERLPVQRRQFGGGLVFAELGDDVPGDVNVLAAVEMLLHRTELEPVKFL